MILDTHDSLFRYTSLFCEVDPTPLFDWLLNCQGVEPGTRVEFAGDKLFARVLQQDTGARNAFKWESHREYVDLQFVLGGGEIIEWAPAAQLAASTPYDAKMDFQFYAEADSCISLPVSAGLFVFLFPSDAHKPLVSNGSDRFVHKAIAKIHRSFLRI